MKRIFWLAVSILVILGLMVGSCSQPESQPVPAPVSEVLPAEHPTDFPESLRWLTEEEQARMTEIALSTPAALEWLQKESQYQVSIGWIALNPSHSGEGYSGYRRFEYDIVEEGIPRGTVDITPPGSAEKIVSVGVPEDAEIYPEITILFGEPAEWVVSAAIDLATERVVYSENYPARKGPSLPEE
jgi:hypothetical protein